MKTSVFCVPYFKDISGYGPPANIDTQIKRSKKEIDHYLTHPKPWSQQEKEKFTAAVSK